MFLADTLLRSYSENFEKFLRKNPWRSFVLAILQTLDLKLYKNTILLWMFLYKFWKFLRAALPLKTLCDHLWVKSIYYIKKYLQNTSKTLLKTSTYMLKIISLTVTSHSHKFSENFTSIPECFTFFFLIKNRENSSITKKSASCLADPAGVFIYADHCFIFFRFYLLNSTL